MRPFGVLWRLFWTFVPHRCRFREPFLGHAGLCGLRCTRCGETILLNRRW